jgi:hypothetical protein
VITDLAPFIARRASVAMAHRERHRRERIAGCAAAYSERTMASCQPASLVVGVAAAAAAGHEVLIAGSAGLVAGALSMAAVEYVIGQFSSDTEQADLGRERHELLRRPRWSALREWPSGCEEQRVNVVLEVSTRNRGHGSRALA